MQITKKHNATFFVQPLQPSRCLRIYCEGGGDGSVQTFDAIGGGYYPDYTSFPVILEPVITVVDPDGLLGTGDININKDLANAKWTVEEDGVATVIQPGNTSYEVTTSGENLGRLKIKRNVRPTHSLTFSFDADYLDRRNPDVSNILKIHLSHMLDCDIQMQRYIMSWDISKYILYDPYGGNVKTVTTKVYSGKSQVPNSRCRCRWQTRLNGAWVDFGSDISVNFAEVSQDTMSLTINLDFMGEDAVIRCVGYVGEDSADVEAKLAQGKSLGELSTLITRRLPRFDVEIFNTPETLSRNQKAIYPRAVADTTRIQGGDPEKEAVFEWETAPNNARSQLTYTKVATGMRPTIKTDKVTETYGQMIRLNVRDRGTWKYLTDGSGRIITDGSGRPIMAR